MTTNLRYPVSVELACGATFVYLERVILDVQVRIAAEAANIRGAGCLILYEEEDQFILGKDTLSSLGIGGGSIIANLEEGPATDPDGDDLTTNSAAEVGLEVDSDILNLLSSMENTALLEECKDCGLAHELYELPVQHRVIWWNQLVHDPPATVEPLFGEVPGRRLPCNFQDKTVSKATK